MKSIKQLLLLLLCPILSSVAWAVSTSLIEFESGSIIRGNDTTAGSFNGWQLHGSPSYSPFFGSPGRIGSQAMGFRVKNDLTWYGSERSEIRGPSVDVDNKETVWYGFSVYIPQVFPTPTGAWFIFTQQWQDKGTYSSLLSPPVGFSINNSLALRVTARGDSRTSGVTNTNCQYIQTWDNLFTFQRGTWYDFLYRVKWDPMGQGSILVKYKKSTSNSYVTIVNRSGVKMGYNSGAPIYFKCGIYRGFPSTGPGSGTPNNGNLEHALYIDAMRRADTESEVTR